MRRLVATVAVLGLVAVVEGGGGTAGALPTPPASTPVSMAVQPAPQIPRDAQPTGAVASTVTVTGAVVLKPRDETALTQFIRDVTNKQSPLFHQYLAPGAFAKQFGPAQATIDAVESQLRADGLQVTSVASDGLLVTFTGSASRVEHAFQTGLSSYRLADGTMGQATTSPIRLPSTMVGSVASVIGLDNLVHAHPAIAPRPAPTQRATPPAVRASFVHPPGSPTPCPDAQSIAQSFGGLTDDQIANAYGAFGLYGAGNLAAGQHIAVFELEQFAPSDVQAFDTCYFGASAAAAMLGRLSTIAVDGGQPTGPGSGEAALDIQDVSAIAPGANIDVYEAPNTTFGAIDEYAAIVNNDRDQVVTSSWGLCEQAVQLGEPGIMQAENFLFEQAAAQGQTVFSAAGDTGSDDCNAFRPPAPAPGQNPLSVDDPASQPYVLSVGGTTIDNAATLPPQEHVWNDGANWGAGGGGISMSWAMPTWQADSRLAGISKPGSADYTNANSVESRFGYPSNFCQSFLAGATSSTPCRLTPDVSAQADEFTGAITVYIASFGGWNTFGGTSSSAPIWAALLALVNASSTCAANPATATGVGFASPLLYAIASNPAEYKASFNDITVGNNDNYGLDNGLVFPARTGYDLATGLGTPRLTGPGGTAGLAYYLCTLAAQPSRPTVSGLSPASGSVVGGESITISGSGFQSGNVSHVAGIEVGSWHIPPSGFHVNSATSITATFPPARDTLPPGSPAPQDGAGPTAVIVNLDTGMSSALGPKSTFQYVDIKSTKTIPSVTGLSPYGGLESSPGQVTIFGSGFTGATKVTFGGVTAPTFTVRSPFEITLTPPPYSAASTACAASLPGQSPATDVCQVQVKVSNAHGTSTTGQILPPYEGASFMFDSMGVVEPPPGCGCEVVPGPSEFDYIPLPTISSVSSSTGAANLANEFGGTLITVHGTGFDPMTFDWVDFGDPTLASSIGPLPVYITGTELQIVAPAMVFPPQVPGPEPVSVALSVKTLAGQSSPSTVTYAGLPTVSSVRTPGNPRQLNGVSGGPDTGGTPIDVAGQGFAGQLTVIDFADSQSPFSIGTQYSFTVNSDASLSTQTVQQNPAIVDVQACTVTGCILNPTADLFYLYPPGNPKVDSISPTSGPAVGGTNVAISGQNLGCPLAVFFGKVQAASFTPVQSFLDCGLTTLVNATSPPGKSGTKVLVTLTTVESFFTGSGPSASTTKFTYTP